MGISIGNMDLGKAVLELEFQTKLNSFLIELILNNMGGTAGITQNTIEDLKVRAAKEINEKYGKEMITYTKQS